MKYFNERKNYEAFYSWVTRAGKCPHKEICEILPKKIAEKLQEKIEQLEFVWRLHPVKKKNQERRGMLSMDQLWTSPRISPRMSARMHMSLLPT